MAQSVFDNDEVFELLAVAAVVYFYFNFTVLDLTSLKRGNWYEIGINYNSIDFHGKPK